jgi:Ca2+-transporting ATPase
MSVARRGERFIRALPGRIRAEIAGLEGNSALARMLCTQLMKVPGVMRVEPCTLTGRVVIRFHPEQIQTDTICRYLLELETLAAVQPEPVHDQPENRNQSGNMEPKPSVNGGMSLPEHAPEAAATAETLDPACSPSLPFDVQIPEDFRNIFRKQEEETEKPIPWGLGLSLGGLAVLGAKRLIAGKSALAGSSGLFVLSGILSVATGYPFLKRGIETWSQKRRWSSDLILGTAALGLGLLRENLVVLAGLSILQYIHWKRERLEWAVGHLEQTEDRHLSPDIQKHANTMGKWAFPLAGLTWAVTRDPMKGLAVLLAMNPRLIIAPAIAQWKQAEAAILEQGGWIPRNGSLARCARTNTVLVEDSSLLFDSSEPGLKVLARADEAQVWNIAASLLAKTTHPWKETVAEKARETGRSSRTAFHVSENEGGISGEIHQTRYHLGTLAWLQERKLNVDPFLLKLKRMEKNRTECVALVKETAGGSECLGLIYRENHPPTGQFLSASKHLEKCGRKIAVLGNSLNIEPQVLESFRIDTGWLLLNEEEQQKQLELLREQGEEWIQLSRSESGELDLPTITPEQFKDLHLLLETADQLAARIDRQFRITRWFNWAGAAFATLFGASAVLVNLLADAISLFFLSRARETGQEKMDGLFSPSHSPLEEIAATAIPESVTAPVWHAISPAEAAAYLQVDKKLGLSDEEAAMRREIHGPNQLAEPESVPWWKMYLGQFKDFTTLLLLGTTALSMFTGDVAGGIAIGSVLLLNAAVGTIQERKAEKVVEALNRYQAPHCTVIRAGQERVISGSELVPGDLVLLEAGDRVPADIRLLESWNLEADESMLTGESVPVAKSAAPVDTESPLSERSGMLFKGTGITRGRGLGVVVATGTRTEMGHLMSLLESGEREQTPLQKEVADISKTFVKGALIVPAVIFGVGLIRGNSLLQMIPMTIALTASAIPEGLPVTVTIALSAGIFRMARKGALIRKLSTLETLGRATVICTDKTGTLTKNEMTVRHIATLGASWSVTGEGYEPSGSLHAEHPVTSADEEDLKKLVKIAVLCNNSTLEEKNGKWTVIGDPTEGALLTLAKKSGVEPTDPTVWKRVHEIPFDSGTAKMSVVCREERTHDGQQSCLLLTKGSVEAVLKHASFVRIGGEVVPLTEDHRKRILRLNESWAKQSLRVLAFSYRPIDWDGNGDGIENDSIFIGMVGMIDPPKPGIEESIRQARELGVRPVMITGDHPITARTIALEIGLAEEPAVMTGQELDRLSDDELQSRIEQIHVFARVTPEHKLRIVRAYQRLGHVVAMTGDGVNDTPAIKQADVGIAMGGTGTEVTKETADMVLERDHFGSIVEGVKEGRTILANIRKALGCLLTGNLAEILVTGVAVIAGIPLPLIPIQILLMNLITDALPAMVLATGPGVKHRQTRRMRLTDRELYSKVLLRGALLGIGSLGLFSAALASGAGLATAQTVAFSTLVIGQLVQTFSWRQEHTEQPGSWTKDRFLLGALGLSVLALLFAIYIPPLAAFFHTAPLSFGHWIRILLVAGSISMVSRPIHRLIHRPNREESAGTATLPAAA